MQTRLSTTQMIRDPAPTRAEESWVEVTSPTQIRSQSGWGVQVEAQRHIKDISWGPRVEPQALAEPPQQQDTHLSITALARSITMAGKGVDRFAESQQLKELRQNARTSSPSTAKSKKLGGNIALLMTPPGSPSSSSTSRGSSRRYRGNRMPHALTLHARHLQDFVSRLHGGFWMRLNFALLQCRGRGGNLRGQTMSRASYSLRCSSHNSGHKSC